MRNLLRLPILMAALLLAGPAFAQSEQPEARDSYLFQVVLLIGDKSGSSSVEGVSANVVKALDDIREFLPYKSYRVLDTALLRSAGHVDGLMAGPDGQDYRVEMRIRPGPGNRLSVQGFALIDMGSPLPPRKQGSSEKIPPLAPRAARTLINSSFSLDVGETIVVGSSKLNGSGQALLALLTVIP